MYVYKVYKYACTFMAKTRCVQFLQMRIMCHMVCMLSALTLHIMHEIDALFNIVNECNYNNDAN